MLNFIKYKPLFTAQSEREGVKGQDNYFEKQDKLCSPPLPDPFSSIT